MNFIERNYKDLMAFSILIVCLASLIFKNNLPNNLFQVLANIMTGCLGFILRGKI